jgi:hypothetical protein
VSATDGEMVAFVFSGDTYVFAQNDGEDLFFELEGVTGVNGLAEATTTYSSALTSVITFIDIV